MSTFKINTEKHMKRTLLFSSTISLAMVMALTGCNSNTNADNTVSISGKAIDPYLKDATVYADTNGNGQQDADEPTVTTDANGTYTLNIPDTNDTYTLYVTGGSDTYTKEDFNGTLSAVVSGIQDAAEGHLAANITPLTTLVAARYHELNETSLDDVKSAVADYLDLNITEIDADVVKLANDFNDTKAFKTAFALEKAAEKYADDRNASTNDFYRDLAKKSTNDNTWVEDSNQSSLINDILNATGNDVHAILSGAGYAGQSAGNAGADAGANAGDQGTSAGQDAGNAGADAGHAAANPSL